MGLNELTQLMKPYPFQKLNDTNLPNLEDYNNAVKTLFSRIGNYLSYLVNNNDIETAYGLVKIWNHIVDILGKYISEKDMEKAIALAEDFTFFITKSYVEKSEITFNQSQK